MAMPPAGYLRLFRPAVVHLSRVRFSRRTRRASSLRSGCSTHRSRSDIIPIPYSSGSGYEWPQSSSGESRRIFDLSSIAVFRLLFSIVWIDNLYCSVLGRRQRYDFLPSPTKNCNSQHEVRDEHIADTISLELLTHSCSNLPLLEENETRQHGRFVRVAEPQCQAVWRLPAASCERCVSCRCVRGRDDGRRRAAAFCGAKVSLRFRLLPSRVRPILELSSPTPAEDGAHCSAVVLPRLSFFRVPP